MEDRQGASDIQVASEIKSMVIDLVAKINAARARGVVTQFTLGNDQTGDYVLAKFEALRMMKLEQ